ncbi:alpha/beta hydrolase [Gaoshiqia sediminis]|uniref:Alpha/beta hydrolase n=1 Tax=Gaoshiqia sediminis TaxID=2986998 RepID=A0AA42C422_9BACT|nr:alpha/beta hydrolase [Gaoshiqia sediminis]MCW0481323.1 alpha/beta hydrolase [Gaoshiqia sediminis]
MIKYRIVTSLVLIFFSELAYAQEYIPLWSDGKMPNSKGMKLERLEERERVTQIDVPGMYAFFSSKEENTGSAVLIFPPGGYRKMTYNIAGLQLAKWFNTFGVNAFVVMYRLPTSLDLKEPEFGPITDGQRALKMVRANAARWSINPGKIGVMGCSAGSGLTANMATFTTDYAAIGDSLDAVPVNPDFQILVSGAISMTQDAHEGSHDALLGEEADEKLEVLFSGELNVTGQTPPAFIICAADDPVVNPMNSLRYFEALQKAGISSCLHIFPKGGHSIALRNNPGSTNLWTVLCEAWLKEMGF